MLLPTWKNSTLNTTDCQIDNMIFFATIIGFNETVVGHMRVRMGQ
jgi:hypothetical protein